MASLFPNATTYATLVAADANFRVTVWNQVINLTHKYRSKFRHFSGPPGSGMPVCKESDLSAGMGQDVIFNTVAPILGQGKRGEDMLRDSTVALNESSNSVRVDLERQGIGFSQLINWVRKNLNPEAKSAELLGDWSVRKYDDNILIKYREYARLTAPGTNQILVNSRAAETNILTADKLSPSIIEGSKANLMALGAKALANDIVENGAVIPQFLFYAPDAFVRPLRSNSTFLGTLQYGDVRGKDNALFTGRYPMWDNNIIYADEEGAKTNDGDGRQGSPMLPLAFLGTAITDATMTTITGGGTTYPAGTGDYFAYFPGFSWYIVNGETLPTDTGTYYAMIYNLSGAAINSYEIVSYTASGVAASGATITVTRGSATDGKGNQAANTAGRFTTSHPSGSVILPCTDQGVPLGWALHTGADSMRYASGMFENQRAEQSDDFDLLRAIAIQSIRGMTVYTDKRSVAPNFVVVKGAVSHPFANPVAYTG
jgi:hypothetical protein